MLAGWQTGRKITNYGELCLMFGGECKEGSIHRLERKFLTKVFIRLADLGRRKWPFARRIRGYCGIHKWGSRGTEWPFSSGLFVHCLGFIAFFLEEGVHLFLLPVANL